MEDRTATQIQRDAPGWVQTTNGYREITVWMGYDIAEPYEVKLTFVTSQLVTWKLDRALFREGLSRNSGEGDIHLIPEKRWLRIVLRPPQAAPVHVLVEATDIAAFLQASDQLVQAGREAEQLDVDGALYKLLS